MKAEDIEMLISEHWYRCRLKAPNSEIPMRKDINLADLGTMHNHSFIVRKTGETNFIIRVGARTLSQAMQMDTRGMQLISFFHPTARARALDMIDKTFSFPACQRIELAFEEGGNAPSNALLFLLPLRGASGYIDHALGGYIPKTSAEHKDGRRFYAKSEEPRPLFKSRAPLFPPAPNAYRVAEQPTPFITPSGKRTHLRLVSRKNDLHHS